MNGSRLDFAPHRPLPPGSPEYVKRPEGSGADLAAQVRAGWRRIAIFGSHGVGISTELAALEHELRDDRSVFRIAIGRTFNLRRVESSTQVLAHVLERLPAEIGNDGPSTTVPCDGFPREAMRRALRRVANPVLIIDDIDKCEADLAAVLIKELFSLSEEAAVVLAAPCSRVYGPAALLFAEQDARVVALRPVLVWGSPAEDVRVGKRFLEQIAERRILGGAMPFEADVMPRAAIMSGGMPRVFLQLLRDSQRHTVIACRSSTEMLDLNQAERDHGEQLRRYLLGQDRERLADAELDHQDSRRRILLPGDVEALLAAEGTDGCEIDLDRKLRFLGHGQMLDYKRGDRIVMHMAPTLARALRIPQDLTS